MSKHAVLFPMGFTHIFCDTFNCQKKAMFYVGKSDGPVSSCHKLCEDCAKGVYMSAPAEWMQEKAQAIHDEIYGAVQKQLQDLVEHNGELLEVVKQQKEQLEQLQPAPLEEKEEEQTAHEAVPVVEEPALTEEQVNKLPDLHIEYRCLDCGEYTVPEETVKKGNGNRALAAHRAHHCPAIKGDKK